MNIPDEAVEAAAKTRWETEWGHDEDMGTWDEISATVRNNMKRKARRDLEIAAPILMSVAWSYGVRDGERNAALGTYAPNPYKTRETDEDPS